MRWRVTAILETGFGEEQTYRVSYRGSSGQREEQQPQAPPALPQNPWIDGTFAPCPLCHSFPSGHPVSSPALNFPKLPTSLLQSPTNYTPIVALGMNLYYGTCHLVDICCPVCLHSTASSCSGDGSVFCGLCSRAVSHTQLHRFWGRTSMSVTRLVSPSSVRSCSRNSKGSFWANSKGQ